MPHIIDNALQEFSMFISKSSFSDGQMRWAAINSDTDWDLYGERMSVELYRSMIGKIKVNAPPPEPFKEYVTSDFWQGGMPYLSIAHYPDGNGKAVPGDVRELFIDGKQLKAKGTLLNNRLGQAVWKSLKRDELNHKNLVDEDRIRISIAFLDLAHKHGEDGKVFKRNSISDTCPECKSGEGQKIYLDGYLVHLALTTVPVNPRTIMEAEDVMARKSKVETKEQDALAVLGDEELVNEVKSAVGLEERSILVEMSDTEKDKEDEEDDKEEEEEMSKMDMKSLAKLVAQEYKALVDAQEVTVPVNVDTAPIVDAIQELKSMLPDSKPEVQKSTLEESLDNLYTTVKSALSQPGTSDEKLRAIQPALEAVGNEITIEVKSATSTEPVNVTAPDASNAVLEAIQNLSLSMESIKSEVATIKASQVNTTERVPVPRSISVQRSVTETPAQPVANPNSVANIVRRSVDSALPPVNR